MTLKNSDFKFIEAFHKEYFNAKDYVLMVKPNIKVFLYNNPTNKSLKRLELILALYVFNFWCLAYVLKQPSRLFVRYMFKDY